jgi:hypothetical protein
MLLRILCVALLLSVATSAGAQLQLTEALCSPTSDWDGGGAIDSRDDEWIEIRNAGSAEVSLDGVYFRDGTGTNYHYGFAGSLAAGAVLVVYGGEATAWQAARGETLTGLSLNNSGDRLELWRDVDGTAVLLDAIDVPSHCAASERSYARALAGDSWMLYDGLSPYGGTALPSGSGCTPSPGVPNACGGSVANFEASVSQLKARFGPQAP